MTVSCLSYSAIFHEHNTRPTRLIEPLFRAED
jgi:hypothetical protein